MVRCPKPKRGSLQSLWARLYRQKIRAAKRRSHKFSITFDEFMTLIQGSCYFCGAPPTNNLGTALEPRRAKKFPDAKYQGIDRVDNRVGYVKGNVVPCCSQCNFIKGRLTVLELLICAQKMLPKLLELVLRNQARSLLVEDLARILGSDEKTTPSSTATKF